MCYFIINLYVFEVLFPAASTAVNVGVKFPRTLGVPLIVQIVLTPENPLPLVVQPVMDIPVGNLIAEIVNVSEGVESVTVIVVLYTDARFPCGRLVVLKTGAVTDTVGVGVYVALTGVGIGV